MRVIAVIEPACADTADGQPAGVRQILDHLGIAAPACAEQPPPALVRSLAVAEACLPCRHRQAPEWTYAPVDADPPLFDPLTV